MLMLNLSTGSTQKDRKMSQHDWKIVDLDKHDKYVMTILW